MYVLPSSILGTIVSKFSFQHKLLVTCWILPSKWSPLSFRVKASFLVTIESISRSTVRHCRRELPRFVCSPNCLIACHAIDSSRIFLKYYTWTPVSSLLADRTRVTCDLNGFLYTSDRFNPITRWKVPDELEDYCDFTANTFLRNIFIIEIFAYYRKRKAVNTMCNCYKYLCPGFIFVKGETCIKYEYDTWGYGIKGNKFENNYNK